MFTASRRDRLRTELLDRARADPRISGAALTGSAARGAEDRWSDIDLFFGVAPPATPAEAADAWTAYAYDDLSALHHFELRAGPAVYRAFLLPDLLQVDLGFTPADAFGPLGDGGFRAVFGEPAAATGAAHGPDPEQLTGYAWHHVLHARISLERGARWQAEHWISALRDHTLTLACARHGLPTAYAKGADRLPAELTGPLEATLVRSLDPAELDRALRAAADALLRELHASGRAPAARLAAAVRELAGPAVSPRRA